ncbi:MAG: tRNA pseudouridine(55) synthase TruB [Candidatus Melainabacteria bacterium]|nr:tRNA pseudouridine(55) synthase TruB [Candidatus Melainabacteria bacterium]
MTEGLKLKGDGGLIIGFLNVNKPSGITAHDVVVEVRRLFGIKQVGHGGTLDPMATGVLPVAIGKACRLLRFLQADKAYIAEILLGVTTTTDDVEGQIIASCATLPVDNEVRSCLPAFLGRQRQTPPRYSAVHYKGQRLYTLARAGAELNDIPARDVQVHELEILNVALPVVRLRITCSAGTYIRAIARDLGQLLGCGGCLKSLVRTRSGPFALEEGLDLKTLRQLKTTSDLVRVLIPPVKVLGFASLELTSCEVNLIRRGQCIFNDELNTAYGYAVTDNSQNNHMIAAVNNGTLVAVCQYVGNGKLQPEVVFVNGN